MSTADSPARDMERVKAALIGNWMVQNPDRGQLLEHPEDRHIIGGYYQFLADGLVKVFLHERDSDGKIHEARRRGAWRIIDPTQIAVDYRAFNEIFRHSNNILLRQSTTYLRRIWEDEFVLKKSSDSDSQSELEIKERADVRESEHRDHEQPA